MKQFQSTLPARGATPAHIRRYTVHQISIHAPRTGSDASPAMRLGKRCISIHAPRTGSDARGRIWHSAPLTFQSTLPARGATRAPSAQTRTEAFQSTLPARGATEKRRKKTMTAAISIHAPRTGSDVHLPLLASPAGDISIHAPRTGSDAQRVTARCGTPYFNPRSPHGERRAAGQSRPLGRENFNPRSPHGERRYRDATRTDKRQFQSTLPARGATTNEAAERRNAAISIHAPRTGSDPTPGLSDVAKGRISIHAPRTGSDRASRRASARQRNFNPRSPHGERRLSGCGRRWHRRFQSTLPARGATRG